MSTIEKAFSTERALDLALEVLEEATTYTSSPSWSPSLTEECNIAITAIKQALNTATPLAAQRQWVHATPWRGLTDDEIEDCYTDQIFLFAKKLEAKLKEKNSD